MNCLYFICEHTFYARTHVKITRHWKLILGGGGGEGGGYYEYSSFPLSLKTNIFQFQFDQEGIES